MIYPLIHHYPPPQSPRSKGHILTPYLTAVPAASMTASPIPATLSTPTPGISNVSHLNLPPTSHSTVPCHHKKEKGAPTQVIRGVNFLSVLIQLASYTKTTYLHLSIYRTHPPCKGDFVPIRQRISVQPVHASNRKESPRMKMK